MDSHFERLQNDADLLKVSLEQTNMEFKKQSIKFKLYVSGRIFGVRKIQLY